MKYLTILLHTKSVSYCYYPNKTDINEWIPTDILQKGILYALKNNLNIQFVYPKIEIPKEYISIINSVDSIKIFPSCFVSRENQIIVFTDLLEFKDYPLNKGNFILHTSFQQLPAVIREIIAKEDSFNRLDLIIDDVESVLDTDLNIYSSELEKLAIHIKMLYNKQISVHLNVLTDRLFLQNMNNCNAGVDHITLAPDGLFYICPAFYYEQIKNENTNNSIGDITKDIEIKNQQLYRLDHAPICRECDAYHCKRCVWLNRKLTFEVNTPSHEQCIVAHTERNASKRLLEDINKTEALIDNTIENLDYIDPFDKFKKL